MQTLVIIPAFNEEENITETVSSLIPYLGKYHYLILNDCSNDNTKEILQEGNYNFIDLPINLGIGGAIQTGYRYAETHGYEIVVQFDGDGQYDPLFIDSLIEPILNGEADLVIGSRFLTGEGFQSTGIRRFGIQILQSVIKICTNQVVTDSTSGFRAINNQLVTFFAKNYAQDYPEPESITAAIVNGYRIIEIPVVMKERRKGKSSITNLKSIYYMIKVSLAIMLYKVIKK